MKFVSRLQHKALVRKVRIGNVLVVRIEFVVVLLSEQVQPFAVNVILGHRDDTEIYGQTKLFRFR